MQESKLSNKIRIVGNPQKPARLAEKRLRFYRKYAAFVCKILRQPLFQKFLNWIIKRENIERNMVKDVQVRVFPFRKENGDVLAGRWSSRGKILVFPKSLDFLGKISQNCRKERVHFYIESRARATLIHELLHAKYKDDEGKVRELTKKYFGTFIRHQNTESPNIHSVLKMLFPS